MCMNVCECGSSHSFQLRDALKVGNIHLASGFFSVMLDEREAIKTLRDELARFAIVVEVWRSHIAAPLPH